MNLSFFTNKYFLCTIIFLCNLTLKLIQIDFNSFDFDESISLKSVGLHFGHIKHMSEWDNNPPFYYYSIWIWNHLFEINEFSSRLLSTLCVAFGIGIFFLTLLRFFDLKTSFFIIIVLSFNNVLLYHSQQVRCYAMVFLLVILSTHLFLKQLQEAKKINLLLLGFVNFLIAYTHYIATITIAVQVLYLILFERKLLKSYIIPLCVVFILIFLRFTKKQFLTILGFNSHGDFWLKKPGLEDLNSTLDQLINGPLIKFIFLICLIFLLFQLFKKDNDIIKNKLILFSLLLVSTTIIIPFVISQLKPVFLTRYFVFAIPFMIVIIISCIQKTKADPKIKMGLLILISIMNVFFYKFVIYRAENYRSCVTLAKQIKSENKTILINTSDNLELFCYYFRNDLFLNEHKIDSLKNYNVFGVNDTVQLSQAISNKNKLILIQQYHPESNPIFTYLKKTKKPTLHLNRFNGIEVTVFCSENH